MPRLVVDPERWKQAQKWELAFWAREQRRRGWKRLIAPLVMPVLARLGDRRATGDDDNIWWAEQLDGYRFLPESLGHYIELGCGPYTNTRLIMRGRSIERVVCSDPLASEYLKFKWRWLATAASKGTVVVDSHPIEDLPFAPESFSTVVLINVLDHVQDAELCMQTALGLLKPGGYFVFGQDLADPETVGREEFAWFEEGHPLRIIAADVEPHLEKLTAIFKRTVPPRDPRLQTGVLVYAGRKT